MRFDTSEAGNVKIGFLRSGHSGGRWYIASVTQNTSSVELSGTIQDVDLDQCTSRAKVLVRSFFSWVFIYLVFLIIPLLLWLVVFRNAYLFVPFCVPVPLLLALRLIRRMEDRKQDQKFLAFMEQQVHCEIKSYSDII